jgi:hypothetical protein
MIRKVKLPFMFFLSLLFLFTIACDKTDFEPRLEVGTTFLFIGSQTNSTDTFSVVSNTEWTALSSDEWLSVSPGSGTGNGTITVTAGANPDSLARVATVTLSAENVESQLVTVSQRGALSVSSLSLMIEAEDDTTTTFAIASDTSWTVASSETWLTVSPEVGTKNATITVTALKNRITEDRTATITVSEDGTAPIEIDVTQHAAEPGLSVSVSSLEFTPEANSGTFTVISNTDWEISNEDTWLTFTPDAGSNDQTVTVTIDENPTGSARMARLFIRNNITRDQVVRINQEGIPCVAEDEVPCEMAVCNISVPSFAELPNNPNFPDPFTFLNGNKVASLSDWECRRAEIAVLTQEYQYGIKPCTPYSATTGTFSDNTITVTVEDNGKRISFDCEIQYPETGSAPYPAVIALGFSMVNVEMLNKGVAVISFPNGEIASQANAASRGSGKFFDFFCSDHSAGAIIGWSWGASRLIDALEKTPEANINPEKLAVTGCSRNGKGALAVGAFDERIALTIPFESGSGGAANWRVSDYQGPSVQRLQQIVGENCWFRANFNQFSQSATKLPYDHHMIMGLCAPRGLYVIENSWQVWLGNLSTWTTAVGAQKIYEALGASENMGYTQIGNSGHCFYDFSETVLETLDGFVQKFLFDDDTVDPSILFTDQDYEEDAEDWIDWNVPELN